MSDGPQPDEEGSSGGTSHTAEGRSAPSAERMPVRTAQPHASKASRQLWRQTFSSLSQRNFLFLWLGIMAWMGGMQMQMLARSYLVYDLTGSATLLGVVNAGSAVPMLALPLFGGAIADRFQRKRVVQMGQVATTLIAMFVGISITTDVIAWQHLMIAAVAQGALFSFAMPARQVLTAQLVPKRQLTNALALNAGAMSAMTLAAPALGGVLYAWTGPEIVYFLVAGLGVAAVVLTGLIRSPEDVAVSSRGAMLSDIAAGINYVLRSPLIRLLMILTLVTALLAMPFQNLMPVFVVDVYHRGPDSMGLLIAITGGASLVGSLLIASVGSWKRGWMLIVASALSGTGLMLVATIPVYYAAAGFMILLGLGNSSRRTLTQSIVIEASEEKYRGRVLSVHMMNIGLIQLGVLPFGVLMDVFGGQLTLGVMAGLLLIVTVIVIATQKQLRKFN